mmetsp:Transcript_12303/g.30077  ORF Transcript_12303/g.30077 Transcript_12303/m.30077 type:complete len:315 (-) Transcript_12303:545-1489(-)|eukprot:CAMPEP_0202861682 /NCGR_PEP_ID=MMETSP1391-20130828/2997_1 /ASSEMBLY_ACC=CAM_ASM_000867 /TAXON_ID=1034604 /ORGANISM="Chlamydomonas leiostraca, Strain SAG 11-49" /LENGTH=314 /DNA_ID=CAMNT_0049541111 /DNA_START=120 /DNA_END=1064 /DNA_ORIENTATION=-
MTAGVEVTEGSWKNSRGDVLRTFTLLPTAPTKPKGVLVWHHGFSEHAGRHLHVLSDIVKKTGFMVFAYDCHGHGKSGPLDPVLRAYVHHWHHLRDDLLGVVDEVVLPAARARGVPEGRLFLGGHSMGGLTALTAALARPAGYAGLVLSSPLVCVRPRQSWGEWFQLLVLRALDLVIPAVPFLPRKPASVGIRDPAAMSEVVKDPLWYRDKIKVRTIVSCVNATDAIKAGLHKVTQPVYVQQGTMDQTCHVVSMRRLLPRFGSRDVTYFEVQGGYHELLYDPETPQCVARMCNWLDEHTTATATVTAGDAKDSKG